MPAPPRYPLFPYTTLFRSIDHMVEDQRLGDMGDPPAGPDQTQPQVIVGDRVEYPVFAEAADLVERRPPHDRRRQHDGIASDRKSTRLNSSHQISSYAVICL